EPAGPPERPEPGDAGDARKPADDRDVAEVAEAEGLLGFAVEARDDGIGGVAAGLDPALGDAGHGLVRLPRLHGGVADDEDLRMPGDREVRPHLDPPGPVRL